MLRAMAEIEFADGRKVVDDVYVEPINQVTDGAPERFTFQTVMGRLGDFVSKDILRQAQKSIISEHMKQWG